jgi:hypothetical protein
MIKIQALYQSDAGEYVPPSLLTPVEALRHHEERRLMARDFPRLSCEARRAVLDRVAPMRGTR